MKKASISAEAKMNRILIEAAERLLEKYSNDFSNPQRLEELIRLTQRIDLKYFVELRMLPKFEKLFETLSKIFSAHENQTILNEISLTFKYFISDIDDEGSSNPILATASRLYQEFVSFKVDQLISYLQAAKQMDFKVEIDVEILNHILKTANQIRCLSCDNTEFFEISALNQCQFDDSVGFYSLMNVMLELALQILQVSGSEETSAMCVRAVDVSLQSMTNETTFSVLHIVQKDKNDRKIDDIDSVKGKISRLLCFNFRILDFCEVIVSSPANLSIRTPLSMRYAALKSLLVHYPIILSNQDLFKDVRSEISVAFQTDSMALMGRIIELTASCPSSCSKDQFIKFKENLCGDVAVLFDYVHRGYISVQFASPILKWTGCPDNAYIYSRTLSGNNGPDCGSLGGVLNTICESYLTNSMKELTDVISEERKDSGAIRNYAESLFHMLLETIQNSMFLYLTCQCPDIKITEQLFDVISAQIKQWSVHFRKISNASAQGLISSGLVRLMTRGTSYLIELIGSWEKTAEEAR